MSYSKDMQLEGHPAGATLQVSQKNKLFTDFYFVQNKRGNVQTAGHQELTLRNLVSYVCLVSNKKFKKKFNVNFYLLFVLLNHPEVNLFCLT